MKTNITDFPNSVITFSPGQQLGSLPLEVGILLPTVPGNRIVLEALQKVDTPLEQVAIGIFAADPFLNLNSLLPKLQRANVNWVCNLPSLAQHEANFQRDLSEIDLTLAYEMRQLALCRDAGLKTILVVSQGIDRSLVEDLKPDAIAMVPAVSEFTEGFPKLARLKVLEAKIKQDLEAADYAGLILCYREQPEESEPLCLSRPSIIEQVDSNQT